MENFRKKGYFALCYTLVAVFYLITILFGLGRYLTLFVLLSLFVLSLSIKRIKDKYIRFHALQAMLLLAYLFIIHSFSTIIFILSSDELMKLVHVEILVQITLVWNVLLLVCIPLIFAIAAFAGKRISLPGGKMLSKQFELEEFYK